jgi:hypothetical protein
MRVQRGRRVCYYLHRWRGGILFDLAGVLLAIPVITIFKVFVSSTARQLKAYGLI